MHAGFLKSNGLLLVGVPLPNCLLLTYPSTASRSLSRTSLGTVQNIVCYVDGSEALLVSREVNHAVCLSVCLSVMVTIVYPFSRVLRPI